MDIDDVHLGYEGVQDGGGGLGSQEFCITCHLLDEEVVTDEAYTWVSNDAEDEAEGSRLSSGSFMADMDTLVSRRKIRVIDFDLLIDLLPDRFDDGVDILAG